MQSLMSMLGYHFSDETLLRQALTHSSMSQETNNERLEYLGDAVLELCVSETLVRNHPDWSEGMLTRRRAIIVCETSLCAWAVRMQIGRVLELGKSEECNGGREKPSILADAAEAIIGAAYLDGGLEAAKILVSSLLQTVPGEDEDAKTELQTLLQRHGDVEISYQLIRTVGPPHDMTFYVKLTAAGEELATGCGKSKKAAEQIAAADALKQLRMKK